MVLLKYFLQDEDFRIEQDECEQSEDDSYNEDSDFSDGSVSVFFLIN